MAQPIVVADTSAPAVQALFKRAIVLYQAGKVREAIALYGDVVRIDAGHVSAWTNLGMALRQIGRFEASVAATKRALELKPENASVLTNLGNCLVDMDRLDEAVAVHEKALALRPDDFLMRRNYSITLREACAFEQAMVHFNILRDMRPDDITIEWERALTYLQLGQYTQGWDAFEIRWKLQGIAEKSSDKPRWRGEDINGKTLLVYEEQGFGDTILCSRYIPMIAALGGRVILECKKPLHQLMSALTGIAAIIEPGQVPTSFDYHIPMMSLPQVFKTELSNIPMPATLYAAQKPPVEAQRLLDLGKGRFKVGIVWSGSVTFANNRKRAVAATRFLKLTEVPGVQLYSLQKGPCEKDLHECNGNDVILELGPHVQNFAETAAVLKELDLVIMTDSSVAHLAGSLGVPVWNLLCYRPYWLYLTGRDDTPWYPSMRLFRQTKPGDWDELFSRVMDELTFASTMKANHLSADEMGHGN